MVFYQMVICRFIIYFEFSLILSDFLFYSKLMGTSISTTQTLSKLESQREQRSQGKFNKKTKKNQHLIPMSKRETQRENLPVNKPQQQSKNNIGSQDLQNFSIRLQAQYNTSVQTKNTHQKIIQSKKSLPSKQSFKEIIPPEKKQSIGNFGHESQNYSQTLKPQTTFNTKVFQKYSSIQSQNKQESPIKPVVHLQTQNNEVSKKISVFEPAPLFPQFSQFSDRQMSEKQRKRKQDAIKYIKDSQFLGNKRELSNKVYQIKTLSPRKVEQLLPFGPSIKLTPDEEELDLPPKSSEEMLRKKKSNSDYSMNNARRY